MDIEAIRDFCNKLPSVTEGVKWANDLCFMIGEKMFCSPRTVESYRDSAFEKLGVKTRVALALYAVKAGLHKL